MKDEVEDMFFYLAWLEKTSSNFITIDSGNEGSEAGFETNGCPIARGHVKFGLGN